MAAVEAWFLGGPVDGRLMAVEVATDGRPPTVVKLPQTGFYVGANDVEAPAIEHTYALADKLDGTEVYQYCPQRRRRPTDGYRCGRVPSTLAVGGRRGALASPRPMHYESAVRASPPLVPHARHGIAVRHRPLRFAGLAAHLAARTNPAPAMVRIRLLASGA